MMVATHEGCRELKHCGCGKRYIFEAISERSPDDFNREMQVLAYDVCTGEIVDACSCGVSFRLMKRAIQARLSRNSED